MNYTFSSACIVDEYRYALIRWWGNEPGEPEGVRDYYQDAVAFIGLNPSTADAYQDDPTIRRCRNFARAWGHPGMWMLNLFAFRATDPKDMKATDDPVGPKNDEEIIRICQKVRRVVCCWGTHGAHQRRGDKVLTMLARAGIVAECLGRTKKDLHPKHPLYLKADTRPFAMGETL